MKRASKGALSAEELLAGLPRHTALAADMVRRLPTPLRGVWALVEWVGQIVCAETTTRDLRVQLGYWHLLTKEEVLLALDGHLARWRLEAQQDAPPVARRLTVALVYGSMIRTLVQEAFHEDARFYGLDGVGWTMGFYLSMAGPG